MIRLLELRSERGLSQRDMARELNISQGTYNNWENEKTQPSIEQLIDIAKFFDVSVDYVIGNADDFGTVKQQQPKLKETKLVKLFNLLDERDKDVLILILETLLKRTKE